MLVQPDENSLLSQAIDWINEGKKVAFATVIVPVVEVLIVIISIAVI